MEPREAPGPAGEEPSPADREKGGVAPAAGDALAGLVELGREILRLIDLTLERARLGIRSGLFRGVVLLWLGFAVVAATVLAIARVVAGVAGLLATALGSPWAGDLAAGALVLLLLAAGAVGARMRIHRAGLRRLRGKFGASPAAESPR